jgi:hypothetical protein
MSSSKTHYGNISGVQNRIKVAYGKVETYTGVHYLISDSPDCVTCLKHKTGKIPNHTVCKAVCATH